MFKKIIFFSFVSIVGIIVFISATIISILNWPSLVINESTLTYAKDYANDIGIDLKWSDVDVDTKSHGFINESIDFSFKDLCLSHKPVLEKFCASELSFGVGYAFAIFTPYVTQVGPVIVKGGEVAAVLEEKEKDGEPIEIPEIPEIVIPWWLRSALIKPIYIDLAKLGIKQPDGSTINGKILLNSDDPDSGNITLLKLVSNISGISEVQSLNADIQIDSDSGFRKNDWKIGAKSKLSLASGERIDLNADASPLHKGLTYSINLALAKDKMRSSASLSGKLLKHKLDVTLMTDVRNPAPLVDDFTLNSCKLTFEHGGILKKRASLSLKCPMTLDLKPVKLPEEVQDVYEYKDIIDLEITSKMDLPYPIDLDDVVNGVLNVKIIPTRSKLVKTSGSLRLDLAGIPSKFPKDWKVNSKTDIDFQIEKFSKLAYALKDSEFGVPAPLCAMDGKIEMSIEGEFSMERGIANVPVKLKTELKSKEQRLFIDGTGTAEVKLSGSSPESADIEAELILHNIIVQLPDLTPIGIPTLLPDSRIALKDEDMEKFEKRKTPFPLTYEFKVKTDDGKPLKLLSNLAKGPIPISLDVDMDEKDIKGMITVEGFSVELFRRTAKIEKSTMELRKPVGLSEVNVRVRVDYTDYIIYIDVKGPVEKPVVVLSSDPPLSHEDIISTLIYGEPFDQLDESETDSVSGMNQAFSNKALSLASMYILASTPIEKIGYDPDTNMVSAKFKIGKSTSLTFGANTRKEGSVGIRRRIGKGWIINTQMDTPTSASVPGASAFIEWHKRH